MRRILQIDRQFLLVNGEQRQIHMLEIAFSDGTRRQIHAGDAHVRLGASGGADDMGSCENQAPAWDSIGRCWSAPREL